jgi:hypothetical protein
MRILDPGRARTTRKVAGSIAVLGVAAAQPLDLVNDGTTAFASVTMKMTATTSTILDTDRTSGLQLNMQKCSVSWNGNGGTFVCGALAYQNKASTLSVACDGVQRAGAGR